MLAQPSRVWTTPFILAGRPSAAALLALYGLLLVVPSADYQHFDGLPASRLAEFLGLVLLVPFAVSRVLRRSYARLVGAMWPAARGGLLALGVVALAAKVVLLASGTHAGFFACYRSPVAAPPAGPCEKSYENPFARFGITRLDRPRLLPRPARLLPGVARLSPPFPGRLPRDGRDGAPRGGAMVPSSPADAEP